ncbi:uncharacterized protein LOC143262692 [Megalopta genalis]|uniref:uncharacterized protein LOC143262692 n=1 Tax=Megalopta genalis TaxID=115081 RepID=UPI003FD4CEF9
MACSRTTTESCIQWGSINGGEIEFESLTENTLEGALEVIRKSFFPNESICKGINLLSDPCSVKALEEVCLAVTRDGVSLVAIEVKTQKVAIIGLLKLVILLILTAFLFSLAAVTRLMELTVIVMYPVPIFVLRLFSRVVVSTCIKANLTF